MTQITLKEASKLSTERLLTYYKKYGNSFKAKFMDDGEFVWDIYPNMEHLEIEYRISKKYWEDIKELLNKRENV